MTEGKRDARRAIEDLELDKHLAQAGAAAAKLAQDAVSAAGASPTPTASRRTSGSATPRARSTG